MDETYNPAGQLSEETVWTPANGTQVTQFVYDGTHLAATLDGAGNLLQRFLYAPSGQLLATVDASGNVSTVVTDPLGSVRDLIGPGGVVAHANYDAFGNVASGSLPVSQVGWDGMQYDAALGLYHGAIARVYDPATGRWTSPDPEGIKAGDANLYRFAGNQTTTHTDTSGLWWLTDAWNAVTTYVADTASTVATAVANAFTTVVTTAGDFVARSYEAFQAGVNKVTWLVTEAGKQLLVVGSTVVNATLDAAKGFMDQLEKFGKAFSDLWSQLQQFKDAATDVLQAIVTNPIDFITNLAAGVGQGLKNFFSNLGTTLQNSLMQWLTSGLSQLPAPPSNWSDVGQVSQWLLQFFKLTWDNIQSVLVDKLGAANVALVTQAYQDVQTWISEGVSGVYNWLEAASANLSPQQIVDQVLQQGVNYITQNLVPQAIKFLAKTFAVPGLNFLSAIYNTVTWLSSSVEQFGQLAGMATTIANNIKDVVAGQTAGMSQAVTNFLNGLVPVGLNFIAAQLDLTNLPQKVAGSIESVRNVALNAIGKGISYLGDKAKGYFGLNSHPEYQGLVVKAVTFTVGNETHRLWVVNQNGQPVVMRASTPLPQKSASDLLRDYASLDLTQVSADERTALEQARIEVIQACAGVMAAIAAKGPVPPLLTAETQALAANAHLGQLIEQAATTIKQLFEQIKLPTNPPLATGLTPQAIATQLPKHEEGDQAHGALVVAGRVYWLATNIGRGRYHDPVVPPALIGKVVGFTSKNYHHIEASAAAILRKLKLHDQDVSEAYIVVNRDFICSQYDPVSGNSLGCRFNLDKMLPLRVKLKVYLCKPNPNGQSGNSISNGDGELFEGK